MPDARHRVLLVDDHPVVREGVRRTLGRADDLEVVGEAEDVDTATQLIDSLSPDLVVLDLSLRDRSGLELVRRLRIQKRPVRVMVLSMHEEPEYVHRALRVGADGYVVKHADAEELLSAVRQILSGSTYVSPHIPSGSAQDLDRAAAVSTEAVVETLSERERAVFRRLGRGMSTNEIAQALGISPKTVETHRTHIKTKLEVESLNELIYRAVRWVDELEIDPGRP